MEKKAPKLEDYVIELILFYQIAQANLINTIISKEIRGSYAIYQKSLLRQVDAQVNRLNEFAIKWTDTNIPKAYTKGIDNVVRQFEQMGVSVARTSSVPNIVNTVSSSVVNPINVSSVIQNIETFSKLHTTAIELLVQNTKEDLINANNYIGRSMRDNIRQAGLENTINKIATGQTIKQAKQSLVNRLVDQNVSSIKTKSGRNINLASYAELVARSTTREATNRASINHVQEVGYDLVQMSKHNSPCKLCATLEGRVFSVTGEDKRYPPLTKAYKGIYANVHPNCRHIMSPYIEKLADNPDADREFSNRPFDIDPRSQASIDGYNREQEYKRKLNADRHQFERYRMLLPQETPRTLSGFRRSKNSKSEKWQELQREYRSVRKQAP